MLGVWLSGQRRQWCASRRGVCSRTVRNQSWDRNVQASLQSPRRENKGAARADLDSGVSGVTRWCGRDDTYDEEEKTCCRIILVIPTASTKDGVFDSWHTACDEFGLHPPDNPGGAGDQVAGQVRAHSRLCGGVRGAEDPPEIPPAEGGRGVAVDRRDNPVVQSAQRGGAQLLGGGYL